MKKYKLDEGETYYPKKKTIKVSRNCVSGNRWEAKKEGDLYIFEYDAGGICEDFQTILITSDDFEKIKTGVYDKKDLIRKYRF